MAYGPVIPKLGAIETVAARTFARFNEWPKSYLIMLGGKRPPPHVWALSERLRKTIHKDGFELVISAHPHDLPPLPAEQKVDAKPKTVKASSDGWWASAMGDTEVVLPKKAEATSTMVTRTVEKVAPKTKPKPVEEEGDGWWANA